MRVETILNNKNGTPETQFSQGKISKLCPIYTCLEAGGVQSIEISSSTLSAYLILLLTNNNGRERDCP